MVGEPATMSKQGEPGFFPGSARTIAGFPSPGQVRGCPCIDRGVPIRGINDEFEGRAPDIGAHEFGPEDSPRVRDLPP